MVYIGREKVGEKLFRLNSELFRLGFELLTARLRAYGALYQTLLLLLLLLLQYFSRKLHSQQGDFQAGPTGSVSPGLDAPRVAGIYPNSPREYPIHGAIHIFVALRDIFVDVLSIFSRSKNLWALLKYFFIYV